MFFDNDDGDFKLSSEEGKTGLRNVTSYLLAAVLAAVLVITSAHAIMIVWETSSGLAIGGLFGFFLNVIRVGFPIVTEAAATVSVLGTVSGAWRRGQKPLAFAIDGVWLIFAAANMITMFAIERGQVLQSWQVNWINYGLPLSALISGMLVYALRASDPDLKRVIEMAAAKEKWVMARFAALRDVMLSPQMRAIERQKAWLQAVRELEIQGNTPEQIRFLLKDTPQLLVDSNSNGTPDLLESGGPAVRPVNGSGEKTSLSVSTGPGPYSVEIYNQHNWRRVSTHTSEDEAIHAGSDLHHRIDADVRVLLNGQQVGEVMRSRVPHAAGHHSRSSDDIEIVEIGDPPFPGQFVGGAAASSPDPSPQTRWQEITGAAKRMTGIGFAPDEEGNGISSRPMMRDSRGE